MFDNGAVPVVHKQSRALLLSVNAKTNTESVQAQYVHPQPLSSGSQGDAQPLSNGNLFIGWGAQPYFSEFNAAGQLVYDAHWHGSYQSYRSYRFQWTGAPPHGPALAVTAPSPTTLAAYASWNGDTRTASWRLLGGPPQRAHAADDGPQDGFRDDDQRLQPAGLRGRAGDRRQRQRARHLGHAEGLTTRPAAVAVAHARGTPPARCQLGVGDY